MDCEKLDIMAIDIVDPRAGSDGVDARALREAEEHLAGCARCTAVIDRLRSGMRAAEHLELEDPSSLLEARILAAAGAVPPDVSFKRRASRAISTLGSWAMRPQVAMAAVLIVMVGTSIALLRGGHDKEARNAKVTEEGTPVATLEPQSPPTTPEQAGAPAIIGGGEKKQEPLKEAPKATPPPDPSPGFADVPKAGDDLDTISKADKSVDAEKSEKKKPKEEVANKDLADGELAAGKKMAPPPPPAAAAPVAPPADLGAAADGKPATKNAGASGGAMGPMPAPTTTSPPTGSTSASSYDDAMTAYKASKWGDAAKGFDASAAAGNKPSSSLLYAARSYRAAGSCAQALPRYQKLVNGYASSAEAPHGAIEGGQCAKALNDIPTARALFEKAKTYAVTQKQAEAELAALDKPPQSNAPAKAKAAKPSTGVDSSY